MLFLFLPWQHLLIGKVLTCLMASMLSFYRPSYTFYLSLSIQLVVYIHTFALVWEVHVSKASH